MVGTANPQRRSRCCHGFSLAALLVAWLAGAGAARAEPAEASEPQYPNLIREAIAEFDRGNFAESHTLFERAYALNPNARSGRGVGVTAFEIKRYVEAVRFLQAALADTRNPLTDVQRRDVQALIARAQRYLGRIKLDVTPRGATVYLDHTPVASHALLLDLGTYDVSVRAAGYRDANFKLTIDGGENATRAIVLRPVEVGPRAAAAAAAPNSFSQDPSQPRDEGDSVTKRWWFWTGLGAVVIGGAVVAVAVALDQDAAREPLFKGNAGSLNGP